MLFSRIGVPLFHRYRVVNRSGTHGAFRGSYMRRRNVGAIAGVLRSSIGCLFDGNEFGCPRSVCPLTAGHGIQTWRRRPPSVHNTTRIRRRRRLSRHLPWPMHLTRPVSQTLKSGKCQIHQSLYSVRLRAMRANRSRGPGRTGPPQWPVRPPARETDLRVTLGRGETSAVLSSVSQSDVRDIRAARWIAASIAWSRDNECSHLPGPISSRPADSGK